MKEGDLVTRCGSGSKVTRRGHRRRLRQVREMILHRFGIHKHWKWKLNHLRWVLEHGLADRAPTTRYDYWLSIRLYASSRQKFKCWKDQLSGPWQNPDGENREPGIGGRKANLPGVREKKAPKSRDPDSS